MSSKAHLSRRLFLGGAAATAIAGTAACNLGRGGGSPGGGTGGGSGVTLNVWGGVPGETGPEDLIASFEEEHDGITVNYTRYVNDTDGNISLDTSLAGGAGIDLYFSYNPAMLYQRVDAGLAIELTDLIAAESDFAPFSLDADPAENYARDGQLFAIPAARAPVHVYINKTMLDAAGITLGETWTVEEFVEVARELTGDGVFGALDYPPQARMALGSNHRYADDGARSNYDDPWFRTELELAMQLQEEGIIMDRQTIIAEDLETFSQNPYIEGRTAMLINAGQIIRSINDVNEYPHDFQTYCMPPPAPEGVDAPWNPGQIGDLLAINPDSQAQDEAWEFAKFWVRNAGEFMTRGGRLPALQGEASEDDILNALLSENAEELYDVESWRSMLFSPDLQFPMDSIFTAGPELDTITDRLTDELLLGDRTLDSWVSDAVSQGDAAIESTGS